MYLLLTQDFSFILLEFNVFEVIKRRADVITFRLLGLWTLYNGIYFPICLLTTSFAAYKIGQTCQNIINQENHV